VARSDSPGDRTLRIGAAVTLVGLVFVLIALLPMVIPGITLPGVFWFLAMLTGVGLIIVIVGLVQGARQRRRRT
jgi:hypothetical protein